MRKKISVLFVCSLVLMLLGGCGKISNEKITIKKYKGLDIEKVKENSDDEDLEPEDLVWEALLANCEVAEYPEDLAEKHTDDLKTQYSAQAAMYGATVEQLVEADYGISMEKVVQKRVCKELAIELIAEKEELSLTEEEYEKGLERLAKQYDYADSEEFKNFVGEESIRRTLLQEKVTGFLVEHCR